MNDSSERLLELLAREGRSLHALLTRLTLDGHAAEDLMQELFVKVCASPGFRGARNQAAYLRQAAIHLAFAWRRSRRRMNTIREGHEVDLIDNAAGVDAAVIQREQWSRILDAAGGLTGQAGAVFVLHYLEGQTAEEIAGQMGKTAHQVRALLSKAVAEIRAYVRELEAKEDAHVRR